MGFEPMGRTNGHGLANRSNNHSGNSPNFCSPTKNRTWNYSLEENRYIRLTIEPIILFLVMVEGFEPPRL